MTNKQTIYKKVENYPYLNELRLLGNDNLSLEECYLYERLKANDTRTDKLIDSEKNTARKRNPKKVKKMKILMVKMSTR